MEPEFREVAPQETPREAAPAPKASQPKPPRRNLLSEWINALLSLGLGESLLRGGTTALSLLLVIVTIWLMTIFNKQVPMELRAKPVLAAGPTPTVVLDPSLIPPPVEVSTGGISRRAQPHTTVPDRPRQDITKYTVVEGDTVFGIAEKFGLKPQTILWGNYSTLADDPHALRPGQELNILPVDGVYWQWVKGNAGGLPAFAKFFGSTADEILNLPANHLDPTQVGDVNNPNIADGTWLIVPGGQREFATWYAPIGVTRGEPAVARAWGPGACGAVSGGAVGYGTYVWPANKHYLSGFNYSPETNHRGIDIAGNLGEGVYATDAGVIVYAGWNDYGYGNMVMIDHGDGYQSLYAHLSEIYVSCGQSVGQGQAIGAIGSTGRSSGAHLHFEIMTATYKVNPWDYLPPP